MIDANDLERMAKERPDECFLKGSGVLKLIDGIRTLEREKRELVAGLSSQAPSLSRDEFHDKAWALYHAKTFDDTQLAKVNIHTIRAVFNAVFDAALPEAQQPAAGMSNDTLKTAINDGMRFRFLCDFGPHTWNVSIETDGEGKQKTEYANWSCSVASDYGTNQWDDDLRAMIDIAIGYLSEQDQERLKAAQGEQAPDQPITDEKAKGYRPPFCDRGIAGSKCCDEGCQADIDLSEMYATGEQAPAQQQPVAERFALYWIGDSDPRPVGGKNMKLYQSAEEAAEKLLPAQRHQYDVRKMFVYPAVAVGEQSQPSLQHPIGQCCYGGIAQQSQECVECRTWQMYKSIKSLPHADKELIEKWIHSRDTSLPPEPTK